MSPRARMRRPSPLPRRLLTLPWVVAVAAACAEADSRSSRVACSESDPCVGTDVCYAGACASDLGLARELILELAPAERTGLLTQATGVVQGGAGSLALTLVDTLRITAALAYETGEPAQLDGTLVATASDTDACRSGVAGRPAHFEALVSRGEAELDVIPGAYLLTFLPSETATTPSFNFAAPDGSPCGRALGAEASIALELPAPSSWLRYEGRVVQSESVPTPVQDARVVLTGTTPAGVRLTSSVAITSDDGHYEVYMPAGASTLEADVRSGGNPRVPEAHFVGLVAPVGSPTLPDLALGIAPERTLDARVQDELGQPVPNASLLFTGTVGKGTWSTLGVTDTEGSIATRTDASAQAVKLMPGSYRVFVAPKRTQVVAAKAFALTVTTADGPVNATFVLPRRVTHEGLVTSHDGFAVANALVTYRSRSAPIERAFVTTTAADGSYVLALDGTHPTDATASASYEIVIEPPATAALPRTLVRMGLDELGPFRAHALPAPVFVQGVVRGPSGEPVIAVVVSAYPAEPPAAGEMPDLLALTHATARGGFVLAVPEGP